ncbi:MAG: hypothetical protein Q4Q58_04175 [Thermoplasmata archaeon]|nr:hypothetical protein [Thermoplasmata archaeon]
MDEARAMRRTQRMIQNTDTPIISLLRESVLIGNACEKKVKPGD